MRLHYIYATRIPLLSIEDTVLEEHLDVRHDDLLVLDAGQQIRKCYSLLFTIIRITPYHHGLSQLLEPLALDDGLPHLALHHHDLQLSDVGVDLLPIIMTRGLEGIQFLALLSSTYTYIYINSVIPCVILNRS